MHDWSNQPPRSREFAGVALTRVPASGPLAGIITSEDLLGKPTHWTKGRTLPCTGPDCPHCKEQCPKRWHAYISYLELVTRKHAVLEITALAAEQLKNALIVKGFLRGLEFQAVRRAHRPNGPITFLFRVAPEGIAALPPPIDVRRFMAVLWNMGDEENPLGPNPPLRQNIRNTPGRVNAPEPAALKLPPAAGGNGR